jgi:DNA-3-methyladenine glycosylase I
MEGGVERCAWVADDAMMRTYHDREWGVPEYDGRRLWEKLMLDGFQAGLSWAVVLHKRAALRRAFAGFAPAKVAKFGERDVQRLLKDPSIIRSPPKIEATIAGARAYLAMEAEGEPFAGFVWREAGGVPLQGKTPVPTETRLSARLSEELKGRGFRFVGPTIVYAWMQAIGMVNDHSRSCFRRSFLERLASAPPRGRRLFARESRREKLPLSTSAGVQPR